MVVNFIVIRKMLCLKNIVLKEEKMVHNQSTVLKLAKTMEWGNDTTSSENWIFAYLYSTSSINIIIHIYHICFSSSSSSNTTTTTTYCLQWLLHLNKWRRQPDFFFSLISSLVCYFFSSYTFFLHSFENWISNDSSFAAISF